MARCEEPIPAERVKLETRLILALDQGSPEIVRTLRTFKWSDHPELACLSLAEIVRRQSAPYAERVALKASSFCAAAGGPHCSRCPVRAARARAA